MAYKLMRSQKAMRGAVQKLIHAHNETLSEFSGKRRRIAQLALDAYDLAIEYDSRFHIDSDTYAALKEAVK